MTAKQLTYQRVPMLILLICMVASCAAVGTNPKTIDFSQEQLQTKQILESAFRYLIAEHGPKWDSLCNFYLLTVDSSYVDPLDEIDMKGIVRVGAIRDVDRIIIERLDDTRLPIKTLNQCVYPTESDPYVGGIIDIESGLRGIRYTIGDVFRWVEPDYVQLYARFFFDGLGGGGWICHLEKQDNKWVVTKLQGLWIS